MLWSSVWISVVVESFFRNPLIIEHIYTVCGNEKVITKINLKYSKTVDFTLLIYFRSYLYKVFSIFVFGFFLFLAVLFMVLCFTCCLLQTKICVLRLVKQTRYNYISSVYVYSYISVYIFVSKNILFS